MKGTAARPAASMVSKRRAGTCTGQPAAVMPAAHGASAIAVRRGAVPCGRFDAAASATHCEVAGALRDFFFFFFGSQMLSELFTSNADQSSPLHTQRMPCASPERQVATKQSASQLADGARLVWTGVVRSPELVQCRLR